MSKSAKKKKSAQKLEEELALKSQSEMLARAKAYQLQCAKNYKASRNKYEASFLKAVEEIEALQPNAFAGVQVSRFFTLGVRKQYCVLKDPLTLKQRQRVERLFHD